MRRLLGVVVALFLSACQSADRFAAVDASPEMEGSQRGAALGHVGDGLVVGQPADDPRGFGFTRFGASKFVDADEDGLPDARVAKTDRMLVYRGQLAVEVPRAEEAGAEFLQHVQQWGGYLQSQDGTVYTVRLPATRFDEAFAAVRGMGRVLSEQRQANDVTEEFVDLGIRLDNAKQSRDRLLEILKQADKVEDILKVEVELRRLTEEIERMEGRMKFLKDQVAMATLEAGFRSVAEPPPGVRRARRSRFPWMRRVGAENVMEGF